MPKSAVKNTTPAKESSLYPAVKAFLEHLNYTVKGEVIDCDVMAVKGPKKNASIAIIELKLIFNMKILYQALERKAITDAVYIALPENCSAYKKDSAAAEQLLSMLGIGLLIVTPGPRGQALPILEPAPYAPQADDTTCSKLLTEFYALNGDPNVGGSSTRTKKMTVYRQQALSLVAYLKKHGPTKASIISTELEIPKARAILYDNHYGWFESEGKGIYKNSKKANLGYKEWRKYLIPPVL
ncbi:MAG: DUF2161 family putative PD-(D/E)XK-type phosphodiesterase [Fibrobacterales bacterium]